MKKNKRLLLIVITLVMCMMAQTVVSFGALVKHGQYSLPGATSIVGNFTVNGQQAFCIEHTKYSAADGSNFTEALYDNTAFAKVLYYGWAGPAQWSGFSTKEQGVVATSLVLSELYNAPAENGLYDYIPIVAGYKAYLSSQPAPPTSDVSFSHTSVDAYYDSENDNQRTPTITVQGDEGGTVTFTVPSGVTVRNVSTGVNHTGTVTLDSGTKFYLYAELGAVTGTYTTGKVGQSFRYQPVVLNFGDTWQRMGQGKAIEDSAASTHLNVDWVEPGYVEVDKTVEKIEGMTIENEGGFEFKFTREGYPTVTATTNAAGNFTATLWPGTYQMTETGFPLENYKVAPAREVVVKEGKATSVAVENEFKKGDFRLLKTQDFGDLIDGSVFLLKSESFPGFEKEYTVKKGELKIQGIPVGTYSLREIKKPAGYDQIIEIFEVEIKEDQLTERIVVNKLDPRGEIQITKTDEEDGSFIEGTEFTLTVVDDIYSPISLKKVQNRGDKFTAVTGADGIAKFKGLHMGKYQLKETKEADGYVPNTKVYDFQLRQQDFTTKLYLEEKGIQNKQTKTEISKKDGTTGEELAGAEMQIIDPETGEVVEEWISSDSPHIIKKLTYGKLYILHENLAPLGYYISQDILFIVEANTKVEMKDEPTKVEISKQDLDTGEELPGAKMQVIDPESGDAVKEWTSGDKPHTIYGLQVGKIYTLHEDLAPLGYHVAQDIDFTVSEDGQETVTVVMKDKISEVEFSKVDGTTGEELPGANLQITDPTTGEVVEKWISTDKTHIVKGLEIGKEYVFKETSAPKGYALSTEEISFTVGSDEKVVMENQPIKYVKTGDFSLAGKILILAMVAGCTLLAARKKETEI